MTKESYFEELSYALRRRGLLTRSVEEDGLLSVEWKGSSRVRKSSAVQYDPTWVVADRAKATLAQVIEVAEIVMDYMKFLNASLSLKAEGLENGYRALADFNGVVWQGRDSVGVRGMLSSPPTASSMLSGRWMPSMGCVTVTVQLAVWPCFVVAVTVASPLSSASTLPSLDTDTALPSTLQLMAAASTAFCRACSSRPSLS